MSGPKWSSFQLSKAEQKRQEEERLRKLKEEKRSSLEREITVIKPEFMKLKNEIDLLYFKEIEETERFLISNIYLGETKRIKQNLKEKLSDFVFPKEVSEKDSIELTSFLGKLKLTIIEVTALKEGSLVYYGEKLSKLINSRKQAVAEEQFLLHSVRSKKVTDEDEGLIDFSANKDLLDNEDDSVNRISCELEFKKVIEPYLFCPFLVDNNEIKVLSLSVNNILKNLNLENNFKVTQINLRKNAFLATKQKYDKLINECRVKCEVFEEHISTYNSLCFMLNVNPCKYKNSLKPIEKARLVGKLKTDIDILKERLRKREEATYISSTVNEVMKDLGFNIIATEFMEKQNDEILNNIYDFNGENAINVFTSASGSIMFEVSGISEGKKEITTQEKESIKESMERFCSQYPIIKQKLQEKGVKFTNETLLPPNDKYARIIDISKKKVVGCLKNSENKKAKKSKAMYLRE